MNSEIKSLVLVAFVASCLVVSPAMCVNWGDDHQGWWPGQKFDTSDGNNSSVPMIIENYRAGSGFAIGDSQYHVLDLKLESVASLDLAKINGLVSDNKTLRQIRSDIKSEINSQEAAGSHNGSLRLGEERYKLLNISLSTSQDDNSTVEADVAGPIAGRSDDNATTAVGHISLVIGEHEKSLIGKGTLTMNIGNYSGTYNVLLNMDSGSCDSGFAGRCSFVAGEFGDSGQRFQKFAVGRRG